MASGNLSQAQTAANVGLSGIPLLDEGLTPVAPLSGLLQELELHREQRWKMRGKAADLKLHWRAVAVQHMLQVVPGESILELGAGSGMLTKQLDHLLRGENPVTSIVFSPKLLEEAAHRRLSNVNVISGESLSNVPISALRLCNWLGHAVAPSIYRVPEMD